MPRTSRTGDWSATVDASSGKTFVEASPPLGATHESPASSKTRLDPERLARFLDAVDLRLAQEADRANARLCVEDHPVLTLEAWGAAGWETFEVRDFEASASEAGASEAASDAIARFGAMWTELRDLLTP